MEILVTGGTGTVGSEVVRQLVNWHADVRVLTRTAGKGSSLPKGATAVTGDLERPETLGLAFEGVNGVFLLNALSPNETQQGLAGVAAAKAAGVARIVYLSVHQVEEASHVPHFASKIPVERAIRESGVPYTILRPNNFYQNDLWLRDAMLQHGVYAQPMGSVGLNRVDVRDIAEVALVSLTSSRHEGKTYSVVGPEALTSIQTAAVWSQVLDREIRYAGDDLDAWEKQASQMMPAWMVRDLRIMYEHFQKFGLKATAAEIAELTAVLGRAPRSFHGFAGEIAANWEGASGTARG